ncbi:MAG: sulfatase [Methylotenera sp. 24-45-7]|jgi:phosphoglycerol transferase MdoB-like AlkP superfamily enzyme|nr:MAG: sulfatase [Methylotenera sp. 24-45-7]OZA09962.1 MAG: sulfatase [Methylotenera sp. 17-45-7]OZA54339.1 MAG: sulfatase [Methylophilales bacterium 39-45-7]HQS37103.1 LTA synthase family protein [Methylotenera sp.]HQS43144.1 LTA synthase family protein [Methylotenera sp.]
MSLIKKLHQSLWQICTKFGPFAPLIAMLIIGLVVLSASRFGLVIWKFERVVSTDKLAEILLQGVRVDIMQLGLIALIPLLLAPILALPQLFKIWQKFTYVWVVIALVLLVFLEVATPGFINEYDVRPNRIFVEYLKYPNEVFSMLWRGFKLEIFATLLVSGLAIWLAHNYMKPWLTLQSRWSATKLLIVWPLIFIITALGIRSSLGHRPANPAMFAITADSMVNSLVLNSAYSVIYASYNLMQESKSSDIYGKMPREKIFSLTGAKDSDIPTLTTLTPSQKRDKPLNLVIILQESLGATFVESLGGTPVTPNIERLKAQGIWFEQLYATGTRSVRGIEAVTAGFAPTPADSTVKLSKSQKNFFTLAALLEQRGYHTEFIYGGESHFDNMRSFFTGNGFNHIVEQKDYKNPVFVSSWGVSDEDLLNKTHEQLLAHHKAGKPFFTLAFSSSNHAPFEFPDGRIDLYEQPKGTDNNAVKYADYAIGEFFKKAQNSPYWKDTVFLIVADHDIRVRGVSLVPVERFHIPGLILGADIKPQRFTGMASQIDLPVTLLSLMGIAGQHPMTGRDLSSLAADTPGRAMMQYNDNFGWMEQTKNGNQVVVLRSGKAPAHAVYDAKNKQLKETAAPENAQLLEDRALANVLLPDLLYNEQRYRLP